MTEERLENAGCSHSMHRQRSPSPCLGNDGGPFYYMKAINFNQNFFKIFSSGS